MHAGNEAPRTTLVRSPYRSATNGASGVLPASIGPSDVDNSVLRSLHSSDQCSERTPSNALDTGWQHILLRRTLTLHLSCLSVTR